MARATTVPITRERARLARRIRPRPLHPESNQKERGCPGRARDRLNRPAAAPCRARPYRKRPVSDFLCRARLDRADPARGARRELHHPHPDPAAGDPASARRPRSAGLRPDRHRQDRGLRAADPAAPRGRAAPGGAQGLPRPGADPDPRARRPDRGELRDLRPPPAAQARGDLRRRRPEPAGPGDGARRRHPGRHARAACST